MAFYVRRYSFDLQNGLPMPLLGLGVFRIHNYNILFRIMDYSIADNNVLVADTGPVAVTSEEMERFIRGEIPDPTLGPSNVLRPHQIVIKYSDCVRMFKLACLVSPGSEHTEIYIIHFLDYMMSDENVEPMVVNYLAIAKIRDLNQMYGITNFSMAHLRQLTDVMAFGIVILREDQMEYVPHQVDRIMIKYCIASNIMYHSYSLFSFVIRKNNDLLVDSILKNITIRYKTSPAEVLVSWALNNKMAVIPKANNAAHKSGNIAVDFKLTKKDMKALNAMATYNKKNFWNSTDVA